MIDFLRRTIESKIFNQTNFATIISIAWIDPGFFGFPGGCAVLALD